ncbi:MAG: hypothetical protein K1060chlam4_00233 [Candidatus Anoxychlamydiales bacterium]|nr:hypothetical protein [Candidatus Anoxychlamydiales bacterium]
MADFDKLSDTKGIIINYIEERGRELFYGGGTEYDFSLWIQAALLFEQIIIPCDYYIPETLLEFAQDVINEAKSHECKVERYQINDDGKKVNAEVWDYGEIVAKIIEWINKEKDFKKEMKTRINR